MNDRADIYQRPIPPKPWAAVVFFALTLAAAAVGAWEMRMRTLGLEAGDLGDGRGHWAVERRRIDDGGGDAVAILGASRILFGTDLDELRAGTGLDTIQLALPGTNARPFLEDLAADPDFRGLLVIGITEVSFFRDRVGLYLDALDYYRSESPSRRFGHRVQLALSRRLAFIDDDYGLTTLVHRLPMPSREGVDGPYEDVWKISVARDGRQTFMWDRIETDARLREHARHAWDDFRGDPVSSDMVDRYSRVPAMSGSRRRNVPFPNWSYSIARPDGTPASGRVAGSRPRRV